MFFSTQKYFSVRRYIFSVRRNVFQYAEIFLSTQIYIFSTQKYLDCGLSLEKNFCFCPKCGKDIINNANTKEDGKVKTEIPSASASI